MSASAIGRGVVLLAALAVAPAPATGSAAGTRRPRTTRHRHCGAGQGRAEDPLLPQPDGPADTSPTPKKDSMGMDYIAVYEGEEDAGAA